MIFDSKFKVTPTVPQLTYLPRLPEIVSYESQILSDHLKRLVTITVVYSRQNSRLSNGSYPLLVLNDGQNINELNLLRNLQELTSHDENFVSPFIVALHAPADIRKRWYGTVGASCLARLSPNNHIEVLGDKAGKYESFVREELMYFIDQHIGQNRGLISISPRHRAFAGFSLGALSAFDIVLRNQQQFGIYGGFSGSFWWRDREYCIEAPNGDRIAHKRVEALSEPPKVRFWFQSGGLDEYCDRDFDGTIDAVGDTLHLITRLRRQGVAESLINHTYLPLGEHNYQTWREVFPEFLRWAFNKKVLGD
ncbi:MAG TPA: alpha/beta hydrolase-fold protein [Oligoflexia bacterium]|nr:alpha/beta hydrolase-fold protein [Oligoflexia bacterium]HMP27232.1 alpha/beta hydrolase-fold protein [Oligoflexia bacterium]